MDQITPNLWPVGAIPILLYRDPVDFRKSWQGLSALVEQELGESPFSGSLYVFVNRQYNKLKCLLWEGNGFVLYYKVLAEEKFHWPRQGEEVMHLSAEQMNWLLARMLDQPEI